MGATLANLIGPLFILIAIVIVFWVAKLLFDRHKYARQAMNHVWVQELPKAGKEKNLLVPIDGEKITFGKTKNKRTHILGEPGEYLADYPPGKTKFVQITMTKITYYAGDAEPLSNVSDRPIISAQGLANMLDGVGTASAEAMRKSMEQSSDIVGGSLGRNFWLYALGIVVLGVSIATLVIISQSTTDYTVFSDKLSEIYGWFQSTFGAGQ